MRNRKPNKDAIIPASEDISNKQGFVNPIRQSWLDDYQAPPSKLQLAFDNLGLGALSGITGALFGGIIDTTTSIVTGSFIPVFTTSAGVLSALGIPLSVNRKFIGAYKKWDQVKTIIGDSLQTWLLENHSILLADEQTLQQIVHEMRPRQYSFEENKEIYFYDADKKLYRLTKNPKSWDNRWQVAEAKIFTEGAQPNLKTIPGAKPTNSEKNKNLLWWNTALNKQHEALQKNIDKLHNQQLSIEDTHTLQRVEADLNDLLRIADNIATISSPTAEDVQSLNSTFKVLESELKNLTHNEVYNMRKELKVKENYIISRTNKEPQQITLG